MQAIGRNILGVGRQNSNILSLRVGTFKIKNIDHQLKETYAMFGFANSK